MKLSRKKNKKNITRKKNKFSKDEYNSGEGMLTNVWGPAMWHFLHVMSFNYPVHPNLQEKIKYRNFILSLQYVLPCKYCRINLEKNLKELPITLKTMENRETFSKYIYNLHELINTMLNKKSNLSYLSVRDKYEHFRSRCKSKTLKEKHKEKGCTESLYGKKKKCIIKIVAQNENH